MRKNNKKGFTIVELVIVIAVIAILAAVLIPTFGNMIKKANDSKALQEATNIYKEFLADDKDANISNGVAAIDAYIKVGTGNDVTYFEVENGKLTKASAQPTTLVDTAPSADPTTEQVVYVKDTTNAAVYVYTVVPATTPTNP